MGEKASFYTVAGDLAVKKIGRNFTRQKWLFLAKIWRISTFSTWQHWVSFPLENWPLDLKQSYQKDVKNWFKMNGKVEREYELVKAEQKELDRKLRKLDRKNE